MSRLDVIGGLRTLVEIYNEYAHEDPNDILSEAQKEIAEAWTQFFRDMEHPTTLIEHSQASRWAGRDLSDEEMERLARCIPNSSIPEAIATIVENWT